MNTGEIIISAIMRLIPHIPQLYKEAISRPNKEMWIKAIVKEIRLAMALRAWDLVGLPDGVKPINGKWVYTPKTDVRDTFVKAKERRVT